jgi:hypothetical protein
VLLEEKGGERKREDASRVRRHAMTFHTGTPNICVNIVKLLALRHQLVKYF